MSWMAVFDFSFHGIRAWQNGCTPHPYGQARETSLISKPGLGLETGDPGPAVQLRI